MLWNWNTIDSCLISKQWHVRSSGMFAGACIAIVILTMSLEFLRRSAKEYDRRILKEHEERVSQLDSTHANKFITHGRDPKRFRPHLAQQLIRGLLHTSQFIVAYFIMLLAMYYNGYILISIFVGAFLGFVVFEWEWIDCV
ncbi:Tctr2 protein [Microthyrium microscopicum]|uniref:Copper transport protein n=1 Tax=Microthyrium microscopicum TaxID=703497 RepID=A0A6A6UGE1_9PEZI|nr:Tctr2 protein [Microthyrium microscopicum]